MGQVIAIVADDRESHGGVIQALAATQGVEVVTARLPLGDYLVDGKLLFERKTLSDLVESINNVPISAGGTTIAYTKVFSAIYNIQATLQANATGGITVEIDKSNPLAPVARVFNASHTAISGATVDFILKGIGT